MRQGVDQARTAGPSLGTGDLPFASLSDEGFDDAHAMLTETAWIFAITYSSRAEDAGRTQRIADCGHRGAVNDVGADSLAFCALASACYPNPTGAQAIFGGVTRALDGIGRGYAIGPALNLVP